MNQPVPRLSARRTTPRLSRDPTRLLLWPLMPLLAANAATWKFYTGNGIMAAIWFVAFIACLFWAKKTS